MSSTTKVFLVSGNKGKLSEVQHYLNKAKITVEAVKVDLTETQNSSAELISHDKAVEAYRLVNKMPVGEPLRNGGIPVIVDDTSLEFDALGGLPGPYVKWFLDRLGVEGLLKMVRGFAAAGEGESMQPAPTHRQAAAVCIISYCYGVDEAAGTPLVKQFKGVCRGALPSTPRGTVGFGWDSIFAPEAQQPPYDKTFAEMTVEAKNALSHRAKALGLLTSYLKTHAECQ
ncbi:Inosine triphosphate pyrophosphatase [Leptomonas seymouri]|uniref:Inosine triphosphate pyrophosphatase n=1 Tax=Leptomonas seymouri TaxID=5684 RepID=A0A0N1I025_LEPSE|nr:Inosine triphosphate pyrophosphatase [Leptomonas seymouri]|eukprot:KPI89010.1 Inosine triphosphate pyrophosphatase [Leptomonas seymouri]